MSEINFNVKVSTIVKFERTTGTSLMEAFSNKPSIATITDLILATSDATEDVIDEYVKEHGFEKLVTSLTDALVESGFLGEQATQEITDKAKA